MKQPIRFLGLSNKSGAVIDLTKPEHFAYAPTGLGINIDHTYYASDGYFKSISKAVSLSSPTFSIVFGASESVDIWKSDPYLAYRSFLNFLNVGGLKLLYMTNSSDIRNAYTAEVDLVSLTKSDLTPNGVLEETLTLNRVSPWYKNRSILLGEREHLFGSGKYVAQGDTPDLSGYNYTYQYGTDSTIPTIPEASFEIDNLAFNDQNSGVGTIIEMEALVDGYKSPTIEITHKNEATGVEIVQRDGYDLTLNKGDKVIISSQPGNNYAYLIKAGSNIAENIYNKQDQNYTGFIKLFNGMNTARTIVTDDTKEQDLKVSIQWRDELAVV